MSVKNEIGVGIFFFLGMLILGYYTILMSGEIFETREFYYMTVRFDNVEGLGKTDRVKINGVESGVVEDVILGEEEIIVKLKMFNKVKVYTNYRIKIRNETALGGKYISIYPGVSEKDSKKFTLVTDYDNLKGIPGDDIIEAASNLIAENRANIYEAINNLKEITAKINKGQGTVGKLVNQDKVHDDADTLIRNIRDTLEDSREQAPITSFLRAMLLAL